MNMVSSLLVGLLAGLPASPGVTALINSRFCGALSMYSTFGDEILRLTRTGARFHALVNITASVAAGVGAFRCGLMLAHSLTGR